MSQDKNNSILSQLNPQIDIGYVMYVIKRLTSANEEIKTETVCCHHQGIKLMYKMCLYV